MAEEKYVPRLKEQYYATVRDELQKKFGYKNVNQIPKFEKIVVNMGVGEAAQDSKVIDAAVADLTAITGQKPLVTHARKSIANFKVRQGMAIGCKVTLRGDRMWEFLDRLIAVAIPRIRDFRGISPKSLSSPRSTTTRSTVPATWTSPSSPPPPRTRRARPCSRPSTSRSRPSNRYQPGPSGP